MAESDADARAVIRGDLDCSLLVEAAAGTGKTTELVARLLAILESGRADVGGVVAVTFTRKAAGELKLKLREALDARLLELTSMAPSADPDVGRFSREDPAAEGIASLTEAIARLEEAHIGTIHSFCAEMLRERPVEAGVDPDFEGLSEEEAPALFHRAFQTWIQEALQEIPEGLRRALSRLATQSGAQSSPLEAIESAARSLSEWRDFPAEWKRPVYDRKEAIDRVVEELHELADLVSKCENPGDILRRDLDPLVVLSGWIRRSERIGERDYDALEGRLLARPSPLRTYQRKGRGFFAEGVERQALVDRRETFRECLQALKDVVEADLAALLRGELQSLLGRYEKLKKAAGKLDFVDLLIRARDLLKGDAEVRSHLQKRFTHLFVDEFQDTDPLQAEILLLLAADDPEVNDWHAARPVPGKLFLVGDPKQSIYRFRRADVALYQEIKERLLSQGVTLVHLRRSFRSTAAIQAAVNRAFEPEMVADLERGQAGYIALESVRSTPTDQPSVIALPISKPYNKWGYVTKRQIEGELPATTAAFVRWLLVDSGWTVEDLETRQRRPIRAEDVCILFRRYVAWRRDITRDYTRGLEARGISHVLVGERSFHRREEVETLRAALTAIEWPEDELAMFATLRGSLFSIGDDALLRYRLGCASKLHPFRLPDDEALVDDSDLSPIVDGLRFLADLHLQRNRRPVVETLQSLLEHTRAHAAFALRPAGNQVLANVQRVCDLARSYEVGGGESFRGFVERLNAEAERPTSMQAPVVEEGAAGVRLMTVHAAKGLQFPVVILADMTANLSRERPDRTVDPKAGLCAQTLLGWSPLELLQNQEDERLRDQAEGVRVAYVAATRARDLLVVPAVGDEEQPGWLSPLNKAIYPSQDRRRSSLAPGCPPMGDVTVVDRPQKFDRDPEGSVRPGLHAIEGAEVVWWDPRLLQLEVDENFGLRRREILEEDAGDLEVGLALEHYKNWKSRRTEELEQGSRPRHRVLTVSRVELAERLPGEEIEIEHLALDRPPGRPSGRRFGELVHSLLRDLPLDGERGAIDELSRSHAVLLGASAEERAAAVEAVVATLDHDLLRRSRVALATGDLHREAPFILPLDDRRLLEGVIDLVFRENGEWIVVDFKTDADLEPRQEHYDRQVGWYVFAMRQLTGEPARGVLLAV